MEDANVFFIGLGIVATGLYFMWHSFRVLKETDESKGWLTTQGKITDSTVIRYDATTARYNAHISYDYEVQGEKLTGHNPVLYTIIHESDADRLVKKFPKGADVTVYYKPDDPKRSVLLPGEHSPDDKPYSGVFLSVLTILVGVMLCVTKWDAFIKAYGHLM